MELHTQDLVLRTVTDADIEEVARTWDLQEGAISTDEALNSIEGMQNNHSKNEIGRIYHLCLAIFEKGKQAIIGWCGLDGKTEGKLHIFYLIDTSYRNKGYATQCAARLLSYAFDDAHVPFINGGCDENNIASFKVMEKIGMKQNAFEDNGDPLFFIDSRMYHEITE